MGELKGALIISLIACVTSYPNERLQQSIAQVLTSLGSGVDSYSRNVVMDDKSQRNRPTIITKYDFLQSRHKKSHLEIPKPIIISSGIQVSDLQTKKELDSPNSRTGRSHHPTRSRKAKANFSFKQAVANAPVIQGERRPDDYTDRVTHRNGRFINNVFIPNNVEVELPPDFTVNSDRQRYSIRQSPTATWSFSRSARSHSQGQESSQNGNSANNGHNIHLRSRGDRNGQKGRGGRNLPFSFNFRDYYVGREQDLPDTMALESRQDEVYILPEGEVGSNGRESSYSSHSQLSPVYYVNQDLADLHSDRSPYVFEPADTQSTYTDQYSSSMGSRLSGLHGSGQTVLAASNEDFVIKEHTYQMCPGCPTFDIPIPVPRTALDIGSGPINPYSLDPGYEYQYTRNQTLLQHIGNQILASVEPIINTATSWIKGNSVQPQDSNAVDSNSDLFSDRHSQDLSTESGGSRDWSPMWYAGLAAAALGGATLISTLGQLSRVGSFSLGRDFAEQIFSQDLTTNAISDLEYDSSDLMCASRTYCEKLKANKQSLINQYPNIKMAAKWILERLFSMDQVYSKKETPVLNECHLRECLFSLVT